MLERLRGAWRWPRCSASRRSGRRSARSPDASTARGPSRPPHHAAKARSVIFLYMDGGPSQVDTFDPKPRLDREHGQPIKVKTHPTQFNNVGNVLRCPWKFRRYGESGIPVSDLFPHVGRCVDDLAIVRSMVSNFSEHTSRQLLPPHRQRAAGASQPRRLGHVRTRQRMPGPARLRGPERRPDPARRASTASTADSCRRRTRARSSGPAGEPIANIARSEPAEADQRRKLDLLRSLDRGVLGRMGHHDSLEAAISNYELAFRMQAVRPRAGRHRRGVPGHPRALRPGRPVSARPGSTPASA